MGNCTGSCLGHSANIKSVIKVQACVRRWKAMRDLQAAKKDFVIKNIGRKFIDHLTCLELRRPTSHGLDTGAPMFTAAEIERILKDKSVRRFVFGPTETKKVKIEPKPVQKETLDDIIFGNRIREGDNQT